MFYSRIMWNSCSTVSCIFHIPLKSNVDPFEAHSSAQHMSACFCYCHRWHSGGSQECSRLHFLHGIIECTQRSCGTWRFCFLRCFRYDLPGYPCKHLVSLLHDDFHLNNVLYCRSSQTPMSAKASSHNKVPSWLMICVQSLPSIRPLQSSALRSSDYANLLLWIISVFLFRSHLHQRPRYSHQKEGHHSKLVTLAMYILIECIRYGYCWVKVRCKMTKCLAWKWCQLHETHMLQKNRGSNWTCKSACWSYGKP